MKQKPKRVLVNVSEQLHGEWKAAADERKLSMSALAVKLLEGFLAKKKDEA